MNTTTSSSPSLAHPNTDYCSSTRIFRSVRPPVTLPHHPFLSYPAYLIQNAHHDLSIAYIDAPSGHTLTYKELWHGVKSVASGLARFGVKQGDVVLVLSPNSVYYSVVILGVMLLGAIVTTANPLNTSGELATQRKDSGTKFICTIPALLEKLDISGSPLILMEGDTSQSVEASKASRCTFLAELLQSDPAEIPTVQVRQQDTAALLYSSGTTGVSKGVILTHRNLIAQLLTFLQMDDVTPWIGRIYLCLLPMFHVYGLGFFVGGLLFRGSTAVIMPKFSLEDMLAFIQQYRVTHIPAVPPILIALAKSEIAENYDLSSLEWIGSGAAPVSKQVVDAFHARFSNISVRQGYGLTESSAVGALCFTEEECKCYHSVGRLAANLEAKIIDTVSGNSLPPNKQGELLLRGPTIMKGYFGNPGATAATLDSEGWLHTGDLCYIDEEGHLYVVDRLKELIKYKGFQVAPAELEATLLSHPEVHDAAVIPFPNEEAGEIPMAFVVKSPGSTLTESEVINFVAKQVAPFKKIRRVAFVNSIPKSAAGKIIRRELVMQATSKL